MVPVVMLKSSLKAYSLSHFSKCRWLGGSGSRPFSRDTFDCWRVIRHHRRRSHFWPR